MEETFARVETKFMLDTLQAEWIAQRLTERGFEKMCFDSPRIQSLYYDTSDYALIRQSLVRPLYKEKLRLRTYGEPDCQTQGFIEIKKKYNHVVYKRRTALLLSDAEDLLSPFTPTSCPGQIGQEVDWMVRRYTLRPSVIITYDRDAYVHPHDPTVRITFDRKITFRSDHLDLRIAAPGTALIAPSQRLMEIKIPGVYPRWLLDMIQEAGATRTHFSKYGEAYTQFLSPQSPCAFYKKGA
ncbi:MAG: polyphosphate polymerase domain-containing protein [Clostridia bacterium]|nr:polyphosphate polymerase domain-containing protein [Clostridia bacterium]